MGQLPSVSAFVPKGKRRAEPGASIRTVYLTQRAFRLDSESLNITDYGEGDAEQANRWIRQRCWRRRR